MNALLPILSFFLFSLNVFAELSETQAQIEKRYGREGTEESTVKADAPADTLITYRFGGSRSVRFAKVWMRNDKSCMEVHVDLLDGLSAYQIDSLRRHNSEDSSWVTVPSEKGQIWKRKDGNVVAWVVEFPNLITKKLQPQLFGVGRLDVVKAQLQAGTFKPSKSEQPWLWDKLSELCEATDHRAPDKK